MDSTTDSTIDIPGPLSLQSALATAMASAQVTAAPDLEINRNIFAATFNMMKSVTSQIGTALLIITHNLGVVARYADRVNVMYAGRVRESASASDVYHATRHPYTAGLLHSVPRLDQEAGSRLEPIPGEIPDPGTRIEGCAFRPRCRFAVDRCETDEPPLAEVSEGHFSACWEHASVGAEIEAITS